MNPATPMLGVLRDQLNLVGTNMAKALLKADPNPADEAIEAAMKGNICRCGTYTRMKAAIKSAAANG